MTLAGANVVGSPRRGPRPWPRYEYNEKNNRRGPAAGAPEGSAMPLYDFRCAACGTVFEQRQSLSMLGQPLPCPTCGTPTAERLVSAPAVLGRAASGGAAMAAGAT